MAERDVSKEIDALKEDLGQMKDAFTQILHDMKEMGMEGIGSARQRVRDQARYRVEQMRDACGHARQRGEETVDRVREEVAQNPLTSAAIALAVGVVLGKLLSR